MHGFTAQLSSPLFSHMQKAGFLMTWFIIFQDLLFTDDDEITELADPAEKLEELLTRYTLKRLMYLFDVVYLQFNGRKYKDHTCFFLH